MTDRSLVPVGEDDRPKALATLVSAFVADPVERWLYPEAQDYLIHFPEFLAAFGGRAFDAETVWSLGACSVVALWMPPGSGPDGDGIVRVLTETVSPERHEDLFEVLAQMDAAHPTYPHWYLPWFGVDAALQGRGLGAQLMSLCLEIVDRSHAPAYLETPNPRTISFYERHGFEVAGQAQAGSCPPLAFMRRAAR